ncbi:hypothetical protein JXO52_03660 [bacterium]|nr:hypothetical protein [bacterium]
MNRIAIIFAILLPLTAAPLLQAQTDWEKQIKADPDNVSLLLQAGIDCHQRANMGDGRSLVTAEKYLGKALELDPRNGLAMVFYGSLMSINAREETVGWKQMEFMQIAFAKMDKAVMLYPDDAEIRLVRGINHCYLPEMFGRLDTALSDFACIEELVTSGRDSLSGTDYVNFAYHYGITLTMKKRTDQSARYLRQVVEMAPDSPLAEQARAALRGMESGT